MYTSARELRRKVSEVQTKRQGVARAEAFVALAEQFVAAMSEGGVPTMTSAWEEVMRRECEDALAADAIRIFNERNIDDLIVVNAKREPIGLVDSHDLPKLKAV